MSWANSLSASEHLSDHERVSRRVLYAYRLRITIVECWQSKWHFPAPTHHRNLLRILDYHCSSATNVIGRF